MDAALIVEKPAKDVELVRSGQDTDNSTGSELVEADAEADLLVEEIRIDDLSIDGMCGVY